MASKVKGVYLAVELDQSSLKASVKKAVGTLKEEFKTVESVFGDGIDIDTTKVRQKFVQLSHAIADINNEIRTQTGAEMFTEALRKSDQFKDSLQNIAKMTGTSADKVRESFARALDANKVQNIVNSFNKYVKMLGLSNNEAIEHAQALGIVGEALDRIRDKYTKINYVSSGGDQGFLTSVRHMMTTGNMMAALQASIATLGANLSFAGITELGKAMVTTTVRVDSLRTAFESIYKDSNRAAAQLDYIRQVTNDVGLEFYSTAEAAKGFFAAAETSTIKENAEEIFHAFSAASSALKLTQDQTASVFLAVSQMMSKGKISAEEMRQQLAERLPGAVQLLASAMGVTLEKLDKMFENGEVGLENLVLLAREVEKVYGEAGTAAGKALLGEMNKLSTAWLDFKASFIDTGEITNAFQTVRGMVESLTANIDKLKMAVGVIAMGMAGAFGGYALKFFISSVNNAYESVKRLAGSIKSLGAAQAFSGLAGALGNSLTLVSALGFAAYEMWQVWDDHTTKGTLKVRDFKKSLDVASGSLDLMAEKAKNATGSVQELLVTRLKNAAHTAQEELKGVMDSFGNLSEAIKDSSRSTDLLKFVPKGADGSLDTRAWAQAQEFISGIANQVNIIQSQFEQGEIGVETTVQRLDQLKAKLKESGYEGSEAYNAIVIMQNRIIEASQNVTSSQETLKATLDDIARSANSAGLEIGNMLQIAAGSGNKLAIENLKKQAQLGKDTAAQTYLDLMTSGDLTAGDGKKFKLSPTDLEADIQVVNAGLTTYEALLTKAYGASEDLAKSFTKNVELTKRLSESKGVAQVVKKYEDYQAKLDGLKATYTELTTASGFASDTLAYKLAMIEVAAAKADEKLEKLKNDLANSNLSEVDKALMVILQKEINKETKRRQQEEEHKAYVDEARKYLEEIDALNGRANEVELNRMTAHHKDMLKALKQYHEMGKIATAEYNSLYAASEEKYRRDTLEASTNWQDGFKQGAQKLQDDTANYASKWSDITTKSFSGLADVMADFATSTERSWSSLEDAFSKLAISICNDIIKIATQAAASNLATGLFGSASSGSSGLLGGMMSWVGSFFADGGVVNTGLQAYSNGVYSKPTFFSMGTARHFASGGVFGEAGPEAIMPLSRMPDGRLGVASSGGGESNVQVNVYNSSNSKAEVRQSSDSGGGKTIDILIGDVVAKQMTTPGTKLNRAVSAQTGSSQPVVRR